VLARMYVSCQAERDRQGWLGSSSVPAEDTLESVGEVGVEILVGNVASEVTVRGQGRSYSNLL
jgi:hypothetical protein